MNYSLKGQILKRIHKTKEPLSLTQYRSSINKENLTDSNIYEDFKHKTQDGCEANEALNLRKQLLEEQGYICCYCMQRINCQTSKIEHFKSQKHHRDLQINYNNLFVACMGGECKKDFEQHCDTKKANQDLKAIDLLSNIENGIKYIKKDKDKIEISSDNPEIQSDIEILNLNLEVLQKNRKQAYNNVISKLKTKEFKTQQIKERISKYKNKHDGKFEPFCEMLVYFLNKKLSANQANAHSSPKTPS